MSTGLGEFRLEFKFCLYTLLAMLNVVLFIKYDQFSILNEGKKEFDTVR